MKKKELKAVDRYVDFGNGWDEFLGTHKALFFDLKKADDRGYLFDYKKMCGVSPAEYESAKKYIDSAVSLLKENFSNDELRARVQADAFGRDRMLEKAFDTVFSYEKLQEELKIYNAEKNIEKRIKTIDTSNEHAMQSLFIDGKNLRESIEKLSMMRVGSIRDVIDKELFRNDLSNLIQNSRMIMPNARFHGCGLNNAEQIIESHGISSAADRNPYGFSVSDAAGEFSVTKPEEVGLTLGNDQTETSYTHLKDNLSYPGGCMFILTSDPTRESVMHQMAVEGMSFSNITKMKNVDFFKDSGVLQGIITTEENKNYLQELCTANGIDVPVLSEAEYSGLLRVYERQQEAIDFIAQTIDRDPSEFAINGNQVIWDMSLADQTGSIESFPVGLGTIDENGQLCSCVSREDFDKWAQGIDFSQYTKNEHETSAADYGEFDIGG